MLKFWSFLRVDLLQSMLETRDKQITELMAKVGDSESNADQKLKVAKDEVSDALDL